MDHKRVKTILKRFDKRLLKQTDKCVGTAVIRKNNKWRLQVFLQEQNTSHRHLLNMRFGEKARLAKTEEMETDEELSTELVVTGKFKPFYDRTAKYRPAYGGISIGHYAITAGTLACIVYKEKESPGIGFDRYILSNNHVLANSNLAEIGDDIYQPGPYDGGTSEDKIGELEDFVEILFNNVDGPYNEVDAAICWPTAETDISDTILDLKGLHSTAAEAFAGEEVIKYGRTTDYTEDFIIGFTGVVVVDYGIGVAYFDDQIVTGYMADGGDSGSLLMDKCGKRAKGLLFAGSEYYGIILYNRATKVEELLGVTFAPKRRIPLKYSGQKIYSKISAGFRKICKECLCPEPGEPPIIPENLCAYWNGEEWIQNYCCQFIDNVKMKRSDMGGWVYLVQEGGEDSCSWGINIDYGFYTDPWGVQWPIGMQYHLNFCVLNDPPTSFGVWMNSYPTGYWGPSSPPHLVCTTVPADSCPPFGSCEDIGEAGSLEFTSEFPIFAKLMKSDVPIISETDKIPVDLSTESKKVILKKYYHVNAQGGYIAHRILKQGIMPMGSGYVYAFDNMESAVHWKDLFIKGGNKEWIIVTYEDDESFYEPDNTIPYCPGAVKKKGRVNPESIKDIQKSKMSLPSVITMAKNLGVSAVKYTVSGFKNRNPEEQARCKNICLTKKEGKPCDYYIPQSLLGERCSICGCCLNLAKMLASKHCPERFW